MRQAKNLWSSGQQRRQPIAALWCLVIMLPAVSGRLSAEDVSPWLNDFFAAYGAFDGSHLEYYSSEVILVDETAGLSLSSLAELRELYERARATYETLAFELSAAVEQGNQSVVRGTISGRALGQEFSVPFVSWFVRVDGKIVHQFDFVDYQTLQSQLKTSGEADPE